MQRVASDYVAEITVSTVNLPSEELKGRIIMIHPAIWDRLFTLQDELYAYLKANSVIGNELAVPIDFASVSQRQTQFVWRIKVAMVGLILLVMVIGAVVLVRVI